MVTMAVVPLNAFRGFVAAGKRITNELAILIMHVGDFVAHMCSLHPAKFPDTARPRRKNVLHATVGVGQNFQNLLVVCVCVFVFVFVFVCLCGCVCACVCVCVWLLLVCVDAHKFVCRCSWCFLISNWPMCLHLFRVFWWNSNSVGDRERSHTIPIRGQLHAPVGIPTIH